MQCLPEVFSQYTQIKGGWVERPAVAVVVVVALFLVLLGSKCN